ncbi:MAG TPA: response regulator transcription factor [Thermoanaerobaculia bacterium]|jgi:DNA-binding NarL/FixJ family response regulator
MKSALIADEHSIVRIGLQQILAQRPDISTVEHASDAESTLDLLRRTIFHIVIIGLSLASDAGLDVVKRIHKEFPAMGILVLSSEPEEQYALRALRAGASGYLKKDSSADDVNRALDRILAGRKYVGLDIAEQLATLTIFGEEKKPHERLSDREYQVFRQLSSGKTVTEIARMLTLSVKTVSTHRRHIMEKMQLQTNSDLVVYANQNNLH